MEGKPNAKGKIFTIIFLAVILLPVGYAIFRAFVLKPDNTTSAQPVQPAEHK